MQLAAARVDTTERKKIAYIAGESVDNASTE